MTISGSFENSIESQPICLYFRIRIGFTHPTKVLRFPDIKSDNYFVVRSELPEMSRSLQIHATRSDWLECLAAAEAGRPLAYTLTGLFEEPVLSTFHGVASVPDFGIAKHGNTVLESGFLVHDVGSVIQIRDVPQRNASIRYAVDQLVNPTTIGVRPGGLFGDNVVIAGQLGTASDDPISSELFRLVARSVKKLFTKIKAYWVGPAAVEILDAGGKLSVSSETDPLYDLCR